MELLYNLSARLSFSAPGVLSGVSAVTNLFAKMGTEAKAAENAVANMASRVEANSRRLQDSYARMNYASARLATNPSSPATQYAAQRAQTQYDRAQEALGASQTGLQANKLTAGAAAQKAEQSASAMRLIGGGAVITGVGIAGADIVSHWLKAAEAMQTSLTTLKIASVGTNKELASIGDTAYSVASKTQFSAPQILDMAKLAATNGLNNRAQLAAALPILAQGAEVAMVTKGVSYAQSIPAEVQLAHQFQEYGGKGLQHMVDMSTRALMVSGATPNELATTMSYLMPAMHQYKMSPDDVISATALAMNVGLAHGRGGASLAAMYRAVAPTAGARGSVFTKHNENLTQLEKLGGGSFFNAKGQFEGLTNLLMVTMRGLAGETAKHGQAAAMMMAQAVFGSAGGRAVATMASQGSLDRFKSVEHLLGPNGIESTAQMQGDLAGTTAGGWRIARTNMESFAAIMGTTLLPAFNAVGQAVARVTGALVGFATRHKDITRFVAVFVALATGVALVVGPIMLAVGAFQLLALAGVTTSIAFGPITLIVLGVAAAVAAVTLVITHWNDITRAAVSVWNGLAGTLRGVWTAIEHSPMGPFVNQALLPFKVAIELIGAGLKALPFFLHAAGSAASSLGSDMSAGLGAAGHMITGLWNGVAQAMRVVGEIIRASPIGGFVTKELNAFKVAIAVIGSDLKLLPSLLDAVGKAAQKVAGPIKAVADVVGKTLGAVGGAVSGPAAAAAAVAAQVAKDAGSRVASNAGDIARNANAVAGAALNKAGAAKADNPFISHSGDHVAVSPVSQHGGVTTHHHTETHHYENHFHIFGADARTTEHLAKIVAQHVNAAQTKDIKHQTNNGGLNHHGLSPRYS